MEDTRKMDPTVLMSYTEKTVTSQQYYFSLRHISTSIHKIDPYKLYLYIWMNICICRLTHLERNCQKTLASCLAKFVEIHQADRPAHVPEINTREKKQADIECFLTLQKGFQINLYM